MLNRIIGSIDTIMNKTKCVFFLLVIEENKPDEIVSILKQSKFDCCIAGERKAMNERITIIMATKGVVT